MKMQRIRVLSYNIHKGFSTGNRRYVLQGIRESIRLTGAQLVFLQEVMGEDNAATNESERIRTQLEYLADGVWPHFAYGRNAIYARGHHGNAILSEFPIAEWRNVDLSTNRFERRGLLHAEIDLPSGQRLHAACLHLDLLAQGRRKQSHLIIEHLCRFADRNDPMIVAGDTNDWGMGLCGNLEMGLGLRDAYRSHHGRYARTFPSFYPVLALDRVYFRKLSLIGAEVFGGRPWSSLSDHLAASAEFLLPETVSSYSE